MSSGISTVDPGLTIPELFKIVKQSFRESEFDEVQDILMDRHEKMKIENENLRMELESAKKDARLLEKSRQSSESEKLNLEKELRRSRKKCKELKDTVSNLGKMEKEFEVLRQGNKELKRLNVEAAKSMDELRREKVESDEKAKRYKIRIENLEPRIMRVEGALAGMLNVKVEDLAPLANSIDKSDATAADKGENVDINSDKVNQDLGNKNGVEIEPQRCQRRNSSGWHCRQDALPNQKYCESHKVAIQTEPQMCRRSDGRGWHCKRGALPGQKYCESHMHIQQSRRRAKKLVLNTQSVNNPLPHLDNGDGTLVDSSTKDDGTNTDQTSPGSQSGGSPHRVEPVKVFRTEAVDVIDICDTDDEPNCDDKFDSDTSFTNLTTKRKRKRRINESDEEDDNTPIDGKENQDPKWTRDDSDDDSSCSDGHMNSLVATLRSKKLGGT